MSMADLIARLETRRKELRAQAEALTDLMVTAKRNLTDAEAAEFDDARAQVKVLDGRIEELQAEAKREALAAANAPADVNKPEAPKASIEVRNEPTIYGEGGSHSYFLDLARVELNRGDGDGGTEAARRRQERHHTELRADVPKREARRQRLADSQINQHFGDKSFDHTSAFEKRALTRTDGAGGYFVPPLWLVDDYIPYLRAGRVHANSAQQLALPAGTDSINIPTLSGGTQTAAQASDGGSVNSRDATDNFVSAGVKTVAGQQDVAMQLLDQSPVAFDQILIQDLLADLAMQIDGQTLLGSGSSGQVTGVMPAGAVNASGQVNTVFTQASPTLALLYPQIAMMLSQIAKGRLAMPDRLFMNPSRWFWLVSQLDSQNRPLVVPQMGGNSFNALATTEALDYQGPVGYMFGLPVYLDPNIPVTFGGATTAPTIGASVGHTAPTAGTGSGNAQDVIIAERSKDIYLWEGDLRTRTLSEILSGTLQVRFQVWEYLAYMPTRYPGGIGVLSGTGMVVPTGF